MCLARRLRPCRPFVAHWLTIESILQIVSPLIILLILCGQDCQCPLWTDPCFLSQIRVQNTICSIRNCKYFSKLSTHEKMSEGLIFKLVHQFWLTYQAKSEKEPCCASSVGYAVGYWINLSFLQNNWHYFDHIVPKFRDTRSAIQLGHVVLQIWF